MSGQKIIDSLEEVLAWVKDFTDEEIADMAMFRCGGVRVGRKPHVRRIVLEALKIEREQQGR